MFFDFSFLLSGFIGMIALCVQVSANPMNQIFNDKVDVIRPPITYPKAAVQWARGTKQVVRWGMWHICTISLAPQYQY